MILMKSLKTLTLTVTLALGLSHAIFAFDLDNPFDMKALDSTDSNIQQYDKHNPFFGLFGAGFTTVSKSDAVEIFNDYYDFCKDHGDGANLSNTGEDMVLAKANFREIMNVLQADDVDLDNRIKGVVITDTDHIDGDVTFDGSSIVSNAKIDQFFESWKAAQFCNAGYSLTEDLVDIYEPLASDDINQIGSYDRHIDGKTSYRYCYTDEFELNRDVILFLKAHAQ